MDTITLTREKLQHFLTVAYFGGKYAEQNMPKQAPEEFRIEVVAGLIKKIMEQIEEFNLEGNVASKDNLPPHPTEQP